MTRDGVMDQLERLMLVASGDELAPSMSSSAGMQVGPDSALLPTLYPDLCPVSCGLSAWYSRTVFKCSGCDMACTCCMLLAAAGKARPMCKMVCRYDLSFCGVTYCHSRFNGMVILFLSSTSL